MNQKWNNNPHLLMGENDLKIEGKAVKVFNFLYFKILAIKNGFLYFKMFNVLNKCMPSLCKCPTRMMPELAK